MTETEFFQKYTGDGSSGNSASSGGAPTRRRTSPLEDYYNEKRQKQAIEKANEIINSDILHGGTKPVGWQPAASQPSGTYTGSRGRGNVGGLRDSYLDKHPKWRQISVANTAVAAKKVLEDEDVTQAAVCSEYAARLYGLQILARKINFESDNSTRFIVITNQKIFLKKAGKISICFELPHESGSLYRLLSHFIYNDLNMTKIESRPVEGRKFEYRFFVDFDGNLANPAVKNAIRGLREEALNLKILGNY